MSTDFAIKVIWLDGEEEYLKEGARDTGHVAKFTSRRDADEQREFMLVGMSEDVQSINVVPFPER